MDQGRLHTSASGILQKHLPMLQQENKQIIIMNVRMLHVSKNLWRPKSFSVFIVSLTPTAQIKHSFDAVLAIKDINGVFALVFLCGLIDLKPKTIFCHPWLDPFWSSDLGISNRWGVSSIKKWENSIRKHFSNLFYQSTKKESVSFHFPRQKLKFSSATCCRKYSHTTHVAAATPGGQV